VVTAFERVLPRIGSQPALAELAAAGDRAPV
jgi:hypothetical protein